MELDNTDVTQSGRFDLCNECKQAQTTKGTEQLFLKSVSVWINKPHVVNRRLCGSKIVHVTRVDSEEEAYRAVTSGVPQKTDADDTTGKRDNSSQFADLAEEINPFTVIIRELIPKSEFFPKLLEAIVYDKLKATVTFIPIDQDHDEGKEVKQTHELKYCVMFKEVDQNFPAWAQINEIELAWSCDHMGNEEPRRQISSQWLKSTLLEKLVSWSQVNDISTSATSLQLVPVDKYKDTYVRLKNKYGRDLVKNWTERTDPKKFVYEDVAIAAYLLLIWEEDRQKKNLTRKQTFVDLGCGNGLLVYILTKEGHKGLGIDLRSRHIWDTFGPDIDLREETIEPNADHLYPGYDWIIGNHSDELTPWIPVIAARSSYECSFFVLPCCHHDFVGKFGLMEKGKSRYGSYIDYVREIVSHCGFYPECDTLRIPSTKRICFIGRERCYDKEHELLADRERQAFIDRRTSHIQNCAKQRLKRPFYAPYTRWITADKDITMTVLSASAQSVRSAGRPASLCTVCASTECDCAGSAQKTKHSSAAATYMPATGSSDVATCSASFKNPMTCSSKSSQISEEGSDKRKFSDSDSGYYEEQTVESSEFSGKRFKSDCERQKERNNDSSSEISSQSWAAQFKPRIEQGVRNCQRVPDKIKDKIVNAVFHLVLHSASATTVQLENGKSWKKGGSVPLGDVASLFDKSTLQELKCECGGLQTLLRNHSHIFQVTGGQVQLRDFSVSDPWEGSNPKKEKNKRKNQKQDTRKTTLCWFDAHHPDGCPRSSEDCTFAHGIGELKEKLAKQGMS